MKEINLDLDKRGFDETVCGSIQRLINKFMQAPSLFFTESDLHAHLYHELDRSVFEVRGWKSGIPLQLVHREYPTNFRYKDDELTGENAKAYDLEEREGDRGNYDLVVLNPDFVNTCLELFERAGSDADLSPKLDYLRHARNKEIELTRQRARGDAGFKKEDFPGEIRYAIEFKYAIYPRKAFADEVKADNTKLKFTSDVSKNLTRCINLVFCNIGSENAEQERNINAIRDEVQSAPDSILSLFIQAYYDCTEKRVTRKIQFLHNECTHDWAKELLLLFAR